MIGALRGRLGCALRRLGRLAASLLFVPELPAAPPALRGKMRTAVVIASPDEHFSEAVFVLRDEPFRSGGVSRAALLEQAKAAAEDYSAAALPGRGRRLRPLAAFLLGVLAALLAAYLLRLV